MKVSREKQGIEHKQKRAKDNVNNAKFDNNGGLKRLDGESDAQYKQRALLVASRRSGKNEDGTLNTNKMNKILKNSGYSEEESKKLCEKIKKSYDKKHKSGNSREKAKADSKRNTAVDVKPSTIVGGAKNKRVSEFTDKKGSKKKDRKGKRLKRKEKMNKTNNK